MKVLDLFAGAGGMSKGFELAGFKTIGAIEFDKDAANTFRENFNDAIVINDDIANVDDEYIRENFSSVDVICGGPPCQGFSNGNRHTEKEDPRNKLFFQFIRIVKILKPKIFVMENVPGLLTRNNGYAKKRITKIMENAGYKVSWKILNASEYGVPQNRKRAFIIGMKDKNIDFSKMKKSKKVTVKEAISNISNLENNEPIPIPKTEYEKFLSANAKKITSHIKTVHSDKVINRIKHVPQGGNWKDVPLELWDNYRENRHSSAYRRLDYASQSITIDTGHMNYFHPTENRTPTVRESARIQSFPDDFIFTGSNQKQLRQVGNAVPPLLAKAIAKAIKEVL